MSIFHRDRQGSARPLISRLCCLLLRTTPSRLKKASCHILLSYDWVVRCCVIALSSEAFGAARDRETRDGSNRIDNPYDHHIHTQHIHCARPHSHRQHTADHLLTPIPHIARSRLSLCSPSRPVLNHLGEDVRQTWTVNLRSGRRSIAQIHYHPYRLPSIYTDININTNTSHSRGQLHPRRRSPADSTCLILLRDCLDRYLSVVGLCHCWEDDRSPRLRPRRRRINRGSYQETRA